MFGVLLKDGELEMCLAEPHQAGQLFAVTDANRAHLREWLPWVDGTITADDTRRFLEAMLGEFAAGVSIVTTLWWKGRLVGTCGVHRIDKAHRNAEIGYWIAEDAQKQGIVTAAVEAMTTHLFRDRGMHRVAIRCATGNQKSCAIPERLGFRFEGVQRGGELLNGRFVDLRVYAKLAAD